MVEGQPLEEGGTDIDVVGRIGKDRAAFLMLENIWRSKELTIQTNQCILNRNVKSLLLDQWFGDMEKDKEETTMRETLSKMRRPSLS